ncbi:hypothetical protein KUCAC02_022200, partial [Chaenocephalus aceratus]
DEDEEKTDGRVLHQERRTRRRLTDVFFIKRGGRGEDQRTCSSQREEDEEKTDG